MWVKPAGDLLVRDYRTRAPLPVDVATLVDDHDITFAQLLNHGDVVECQADGSPLLVIEPAPAVPAAPSAPGKASKPATATADAPPHIDPVVDPASAAADAAQ
jgi:hypothetical protein